MQQLTLPEWIPGRRLAWQAASAQLDGLNRLAWMGDESALQAKLSQVDQGVKAGALPWAAAQGHGRLLRILVDNGADPNAVCAHSAFEGLYPLHVAVASGSLGSATSLVTRGTRLDSVDTHFAATPLDWAHALGEEELQGLLEDAAWFVPAIEAVRSGDTDFLLRWLQEHEGQVDFRLGDNRRTLLLYATDWPGQWPHVETTIEQLVAAGADLQATFDGAQAGPRETPLHWAASSNDLSALHALIAAGADLDAVGGCIANGSPLLLSVCFHHWDSARALIEAGARYSLAQVAALGDRERMAAFFDAQGRYRDATGPMAYWSEVPSDQESIDSALWFAALGKQAQAAQFLIEVGANPDWKGPMGKSPREVAEGNGGVGFTWPGSDPADI